MTGSAAQRMPAPATRVARAAQQYIFTISTGRCGQNTLADFLRDHIPAACVAFEEPQVTPRFKGGLGAIERRLRRRFVETHELLGRGRVLDAFAAGDEAALARYGRDRVTWIEQRVTGTGADVYIDVSKHFIHGFHATLLDHYRDARLISLARDPIENMVSYLNRRKDFWLDNNRPDCPRNCLVMDTGTLSPGELYLWIWFETQLRFAQTRDRVGAARTFSLMTPDLNDAGKLERLLAFIGAPHRPVSVGPAKNTNKALGFGATEVGAGDIATFERFLARVPQHLVARIDCLADYDPRRQP